jgi:hypothetical protein
LQEHLHFKLVNFLSFISYFIWLPRLLAQKNMCDQFSICS